MTISCPGKSRDAARHPRNFALAGGATVSSCRKGTRKSTFNNRTANVARQSAISVPGEQSPGEIERQ